MMPLTLRLIRTVVEGLLSDASRIWRSFHAAASMRIAQASRN